MLCGDPDMLCGPSDFQGQQTANHPGLWTSPPPWTLDKPPTLGPWGCNVKPQLVCCRTHRLPTVALDAALAGSSLRDAWGMRQQPSLYAWDGVLPRHSVSACSMHARAARCALRLPADPGHDAANRCKLCRTFEAHVAATEPAAHVLQRRRR